MKAAKLSRILVRDPRHAAVFTDSEKRRMLLWFTRSPKSVGEAAAALGMDLKRVHYHAVRLAEIGLLRVVGTRKRDGRPVKLYRAVSDSFFIPYHAAPRGFSDALVIELREALARDDSRSDGGMLFTAARNGSARGRLVRSREDAARSVEMWRVLALSPAELAGLRRDLNAVLNRYQRRAEGAGSAMYLVNAAIGRRADSGGIADNA